MARTPLNFNSTASPYNWNWSPSITYVPGDVVQYGSRVWHNKNASNLNNVPEPGSSNWEMIADNTLTNLTANGGRLTIEQGVPDDATDRTGKTRLYFEPFTGPYIGLYEGGGAGWSVWNFTGINYLDLTLNPLTANKNYDIFVRKLSGQSIPQLSAAPWSNDTTRLTAISRTNGVMTQTGNPDYRYVGTIRVDSLGQLRNTKVERFIFNYENALPTQLYTNLGPFVNSYSSSTIRKLNNSDANSTVYAVVGIGNQRILSGDIGVHGNSGPGGDYHVGLYIDTNPVVGAVTPINASLVQTTQAQVTRVNAEQRRLDQGLNYLRIVEYTYVGTGNSSYAGHNLSLLM